MTQAIILNSGQIRPFGERRTPLPRTKAYVFSLDAGFSGEEVAVDPGARRAAMQGGLASGPGDQYRPSAEFLNSFIYHVQDEELVRSAEGKVRQIPHEAVLSRATVQIVGSPTGGADLKARVLALWQERTFISFDITGVLVAAGTLLRLWNTRTPVDFSDTIQTKVAIATECESATMRWLVQNQLFGWGRVSLARKGEVYTAQFTFDVYSMAG
jgi:hypothetical protein